MTEQNDLIATVWCWTDFHGNTYYTDRSQKPRFAKKGVRVSLQEMQEELGVDYHLSFCVTGIREAGQPLKSRQRAMGDYITRVKMGLKEDESTEHFYIPQWAECLHTPVDTKRFHGRFILSMAEEVVADAKLHYPDKFDFQEIDNLLHSVDEWLTPDEPLRLFDKNLTATMLQNFTDAYDNDCDVERAVFSILDDLNRRDLDFHIQQGIYSYSRYMSAFSGGEGTEREYFDFYESAKLLAYEQGLKALFVD